MKINFDWLTQRIAPPRERFDAARAYMSYDFECADYLIGSGIVDRDMGGKKGDQLMKEFLHKFWLPSSFQSDQQKSERATNMELEQMRVEKI